MEELITEIPTPPVHLQWLLKALPTYRSPGPRPSSPPSWVSPSPICDSRRPQRSSCGCPCPCRLPPLDRWLPEAGKCIWFIRIPVPGVAEAHVSRCSITDWGLGGEGKGYHSTTPHTSPRSSLVPLSSRKEEDAKPFSKENSQMPHWNLLKGRKRKGGRSSQEGTPSCLFRSRHFLPWSHPSFLCGPPATHFLRLGPRRPIMPLLNALYLSSISLGCWIQKSHRMRGDFAVFQIQAELVPRRSWGAQDRTLSSCCGGRVHCGDGTGRDGGPGLCACPVHLLRHNRPFQNSVA